MFKSGEVYDMEIIGVTMTQSTKKGTPGISFQLKLTDGEESKAFRNDVWLSDTVIQSGPNQGKTTLEANLEQLEKDFGLPDSFEQDVVREFYVGKKGRAKLENEEYNGKQNLKVKGMYSSSLQATTVDPMVLARLNNVLAGMKPVSMPTSGKGKGTKTFFNKKKD